jgi:hypothetical protein
MSEESSELPYSRPTQPPEAFLRVDSQKDDPGELIFFDYPPRFIRRFRDHLAF